MVASTISGMTLPICLDGPILMHSPCFLLIQSMGGTFVVMVGMQQSTRLTLLSTISVGLLCSRFRTTTPSGKNVCLIMTSTNTKNRKMNQLMHFTSTVLMVSLMPKCPTFRLINLKRCACRVVRFSKISMETVSLIRKI